jgi:hypothetical protein
LESMAPPLQRTPRDGTGYVILPDMIVQGYDSLEKVRLAILWR